MEFEVALSGIGSQPAVISQPFSWSASIVSLGVGCPPNLAGSSYVIASFSPYFVGPSLFALLLLFVSFLILTYPIVVFSVASGHVVSMSVAPAGGSEFPSVGALAASPPPHCSSPSPIDRPGPLLYYFCLACVYLACGPPPSALCWFAKFHALVFVLP